MEAHGSSIQANCIRRFVDDNNDWINLARVTMVCRKRNQISSQASFIKVFKLERRVIMRRGESVGERVDIALVKNGKENPAFKPTTMDAFVKLNVVLQIPEIRSRVISTLSVVNQQTAVSGNIESLAVSTSTGESISTRMFYENQLAPLGKVLNLNLCGLYLVEFGQVSNLSESMPLDQTIYPSETYGGFRIGKLGCTSDFRHRYPVLRSTYRKFTSAFTFWWFTLVPYDKRFDAETRLKELVLLNEMKLHFHQSREFVIYDSSSEQRLKDIYKLVGDEYAFTAPAARVREGEIVANAQLEKQQTIICLKC